MCHHHLAGFLLFLLNLFILCAVAFCLHACKAILSNLSQYFSSNLDDVGSKSQDVSLCLEDIMEKLRHAFPSVRSSDVTANTLMAS